MVKPSQYRLVNYPSVTETPAMKTDSPIVATRRKRLRQWIDERHNGSQAAFVMAAQINQGELSLLLKDKSFGEKKAAAIERDAGMPPGYLSDPEISAVLETETPPGYFRFDLFEGGAGMGQGLVNQDYPEVVRQIEVADWEVRRKLGFLPKPGRIQLITGRGPSMRPKLEDGDIVWIDTSCDYFDGDDFYLINIGGETQIKMLQKRGDGLYVVSVNPDFPAYRSGEGEVTILGKALIHAGLRRF
jgi:phage repressor protein C with HTH and peptisase S24 domain